MPLRPVTLAGLSLALQSNATLLNGVALLLWVFEQVKTARAFHGGRSGKPNQSP
jgi:hypothetical protein